MSDAATTLRETALARGSRGRGDYRYGLRDDDERLVVDRHQTAVLAP